MNEEWKPVVGFEDGYEVSNLGRVRSIDRVMIYTMVDRHSGKILTVNRRHHGRLLRPGHNAQTEHLMVVLGRHNTRYIHRLVLEAFVGPCPYGQEGLHWNDEPQDNRLENLRWGTSSENNCDAVRNGKKPVGDRHYSAKLQAHDIPLIRCRLRGSRGVATQLAKEYGVSFSTITKVRDGITWKHVP